MPYRNARSDEDQLRGERPWIFAGAITLAGVAGYVNVVVLGFFHVPVSHMTGAVSRLSVDVESLDLSDFRLILSIVVGFLIGAVLSGTIIGGRTLVPGRRYGVTLVLEGAILAAATILLLRGEPVGVSLAATACGIQNAMASSYHGLILRTTHVTGIVTDIGVMIGQALRHGRVMAWEILLLTSILFGFFGGGLVAAILLRALGMSALAIPAAGCILGGSAYFAWRHSERGKRYEARADAATEAPEADAP